VRIEGVPSEQYQVTRKFCLFGMDEMPGFIYQRKKSSVNSSPISERRSKCIYNVWLLELLLLL
jgi:hypothetical protein